MRAVYRAFVAPLATAMCHWCVRGWTFELGTSMWWSLTQTALYHGVGEEKRYQAMRHHAFM